MDNRTSERLTAFSLALPLADPNQLVNAPGVGVFRAKFIRSGLERGVLAEHWTGAGLCIVQPKSHGVCRECADSKSRSECTHCACAMCAWFRQTEERASPRVSREKMAALVRRLQVFTVGSAPKAPAMLDDEV